jgi:hypothetical protein
MASAFLTTCADSGESDVLRRFRYRFLPVESLESKLVLSSSGAIGPLGSSPPIHLDLLKPQKAVASEGTITGSAQALIFGTELIGGRAFVCPLGSLRVSDGVADYMFLRNAQNAVTARVAVGFVDLEKPAGHQWVAELTLEAPQPGTTYGKTNTLDYALERWIPASQPGGSGSFGNVIRSGTATLRFPDGVPTSGEAPVPFNLGLRTSV